MLREKLRKYLPKLPGDVLKIFVILLFVFPFYWMGSTAFKTYQEAIRTPPTLIPEVFTLGNLKEIFTGADNILRYACNSRIITASVVVIQVLVMVPAAYAFATREFPFKKALFGIVLVAFMIPEQITYISVYLMFSKARLIDTLLPRFCPSGPTLSGSFCFASLSGRSIRKSSRRPGWTMPGSGRSC